MKRIFTILLALALVSGIADARVVRGSVRGGFWPLKNVVVTDGQNFTKTKCFGRFKLDIADDARFVYVVTPKGYTADFSSGSVEFYQPAEGKSRFCFRLKKTSKTGDYTLFSISDPQMKKDEHFDKFCGEPLEDIIEQSKKYSAETPTVAVVLGDIGWDSMPILPKYKEAVKAAGIPFYAVIGNHDHQRYAPEGPETIREYEDLFGPVNWAAWIGDDFMIGLRNIQYRTDKKYTEGYSDLELNFVKNLLTYVPEETHIIIAQHSPCYEWWGDKYIQRVDELISILGSRKVDFITGHSHIMNNIILSDNIFEHNAASLCASWWDTKWCNDGTPRGYEIFTKRDGGLSWYYHAVDLPDEEFATLILKGDSHFNPDKYVLNIWDYDPEWKLSWWEDGVEISDFEQVVDVEPVYYDEIASAFPDGNVPAYKRPRYNTHYFAFSPSPDAKTIKVQVKSRFGRIWEKEISLK